jgi:hypothetical protein
MVREDSFAQAVYTVIERELPPHKTRFSYFPADRAHPLVEAQIQLGSADAQQHSKPTNSQPRLKAQRIKSTIFAYLLGDDLSPYGQEKTFKKI